MPKITLTVRKKDEWIFNDLKKTVETKNKLGFNTDLGFEVCRLLKNQMTGEVEDYEERARALGLFPEKKGEKEDGI